MNIDQKYELLKSKLREMKKVVIAYSGGVDSNFLLKVASDELGENAIAVTIHAMMHSDREIEEAKQYTKEFGVKHEVIKVENFDEKGFIENSKKRCYYCKCAVFNMIKDYAVKNNVNNVETATANAQPVYTVTTANLNSEDLKADNAMAKVFSFSSSSLLNERCVNGHLLCKSK